MKLTFYSVFDNDKAHRLLEELRDIKFERDHNYGRLEIDNVTQEEAKYLRANKISYI